MRISPFLAALLLLPGLAFAAEPISRRDGFLLVWQSLKRPAYETREAPFSDVPEEGKGGLEITYAKSRNILAGDGAFSPDDPLTLEVALVWLFRTRNIADPDDVQIDTLPNWLEKYPIAKLPDDGSVKTLTEDELLQLMRLLDTELATETHEVSLYSEKFHGKGTAFGETFDMNALTAAHRTFPQNTLVKVTNIENGKSVVVRINDRGPYVEGRDMDLSLASFTTIAERSKGKIRATFQRLGDVTLANTCGEIVYQRRVVRGIVLNPGIPQILPLGQTMSISAEESFAVRGITYPDGNSVRVQDFVNPGEQFSIVPSIVGKYSFYLTGLNGRGRTLSMTVTECGQGT